MKNIHVLPTESFNPIGQQIWRRKNGGLFKPTKSNPIANNLEEKINIYITSGEEIKVGDWYINTFVSEREQKPQTHTEKRHIINHQKDYRFKYCKKIILTTDQDLIKDGVQAIDDEFLEWFVKNPSCEEVEILIINGGYDKPEDVPYQECYEIIIPKQETKQERMYSEEEVYNLLEEAIKDNYIFELDYHNSGDYRNLKEWYEQFKNK